MPDSDVARAFGLAGERVTEPRQTPITAHRDPLRESATTGYGG